MLPTPDSRLPTPDSRFPTPYIFLCYNKSRWGFRHLVVNTI
ncbi:hypothetical protein [Moorena sp. SIO1F2]|nr:hypothetical protein [Moorena sp. SIO1F2]